MSDDHFQLRDRDVSGFELAGIGQENGQILLIGGVPRLIQDWPRTVELKGAVYTLERIHTNPPAQNGKIYEHADYV
jgi:hypothetical protein